MFDQDSLKFVTDLENESQKAISNSVKSLTQSKGVISGVHAAFEGSTPKPAPREVADLKTRLMLKYFMIDVDILNSQDSKFTE